MENKRIDRVLRKMEEAGLTQLLVTDPLSIRYLTGETIWPGERMLALLLRADQAHRFFVNALFPAPACGIPVVRFSDTDDGPARIVPFLDREKPLGVDKTWPARFLIRLMEKVRKAIEEDRLLDLRKQFYERYDMSRNF